MEAAFISQEMWNIGFGIFDRQMFWLKQNFDV